MSKSKKYWKKRAKAYLLIHSMNPNEWEEYMDSVSVLVAELNQSLKDKDEEIAYLLNTLQTYRALS
jgi:hypothetical protein